MLVCAIVFPRGVTAQAQALMDVEACMLQLIRTALDGMTLREARAECGSGAVSVVAGEESGQEEQEVGVVET